MEATKRHDTPYDGTRAIAEDVIREDIKACMKGLCHPNLEWSKAVRLAADFLALSAPSEIAPNNALAPTSTRRGAEQGQPAIGAPSARGTTVCYSPCPKHMGMPFVINVGYVAPLKQVCPICEPPEVK